MRPAAVCTRATDLLLVFNGYYGGLQPRGEVEGFLWPRLQSQLVRLAIRPGCQLCLCSSGATRSSCEHSQLG